ncbi:MAG: hypothetical protein ABFD89_09130 [Bryobacteraceae bacterium]
MTGTRGAVPPQKRKPPSALKVAERDVTRTCREYLELRGWSPVRINAGPFGKSGMPDFLFLHYRRSLAFWIEFKAPGRKPAKSQAEWIEAERRKGATVLVVDNIDDFMAWYETQMGVEGQTRLAL